MQARAGGQSKLATEECGSLSKGTLSHNILEWDAWAQVHVDLADGSGSSGVSSLFKCYAESMKLRASGVHIYFSTHIMNGEKKMKTILSKTFATL